jgi:hypothetical protein
MSVRSTRTHLPGRDAAVPKGVEALSGFQEQAGLVAITLEGIDGGSHVLVALGLIEAERRRIAGPGGEPKEIGSFRAGQGLGPREQLLAEASPQEGTLDVEAVELGGGGFHGEALVVPIVGELREAHQVILDLGEKDGTPWMRPKTQKRSPAPLFHAFSAAARRELWGAYRIFVGAFRQAADKLRAGDRNAVFPLGSFPPALPFVGG